MIAQRRYVILDRDGTLIEERNYLSDPAGVVLLPRALDGLRAFVAMGYGLVVVTNQAGIGRGYFTATDLQRVNDRLRALLRAGGVDWDEIYHCPHAPDAGCACRKPKPGLALRAAQELEFDLSQAVVIGDKACDIELGHAVGAQTLLVRTGYGAELAGDPVALAQVRPDAVVDNLADAAEWVRRSRTIPTPSELSPAIPPARVGRPLRGSRLLSKTGAPGGVALPKSKTDSLPPTRDRPT